MTKPDCAAIAVVLDRSGSMESIQEATIEGFNEFLKGQQATPGEATLTLAQFDHEYDIVHDAVPLPTVAPLNATTYVPRGSTALLDAIGRSIDALGRRLAAMPEHDRPSTVIVAIMTDGLENASQRFTRERVFDMITHQREKYGWQFMFLGAGQDAIAVGRDMGIDPGMAAMYSRDLSGPAFAMMSRKVAGSRYSSQPMEAFSADDREQLLSDDETPSAPLSPNVEARKRNRGGSRSPSSSIS